MTERKLEVMERVPELNCITPLINLLSRQRLNHSLLVCLATPAILSILVCGVDVGIEWGTGCGEGETL
jgi:hypothetical protein